MIGRFTKVSQILSSYSVASCCKRPSVSEPGRFALQPSVLTVAPGSKPLAALLPSANARAQDFKDLFSTLIVSLLPLSAHRVRLSKIEHTFLSEDAINNLGSLKFSQSTGCPTPKTLSDRHDNDNHHILHGEGYGTIHMSRFLEARFYRIRGWQVSAGLYDEGIRVAAHPQRVSASWTASARETASSRSRLPNWWAILTQLVILERDGQTNKLVTDQGTIEVIFRRFIGAHGPNIKSTVSSADSRLVERL